MILMKKRPLFCFAAFFGAGVIGAYLLNPPPVWMLLCGALLGILALGLALPGRRKLTAAALTAFYLAAGFGGAAYTTARMEARPIFESAYDVEFSGRIAGAPYLDEDGARFVCELEKITFNGQATDYGFRLYLRGDPEELARLGCGQEISGTGHVFCPEAPENPHEFDFGQYLWRENLAGYVTARTDAVQLSGERGGFADSLYRLRTALSRRIDAHFPRNAALVKALVLGDRRDMNEDLRSDFADAGVAHLLAISGLHITLIALAVSGLLKRLVGAVASSVVTLACVVGYGLLIGFSPSVARAAIMFAVLQGAPVAGRFSDGSTRLAAAFLVILLINPLNIGDAGFVLSFCASAGLIWLSPALNRLFRLEKLREKGLMGKIAGYFLGILLTTAAAQTATYPAIAEFYGEFSLVSFLSNLFLVPLCLISLIACYIGLALPVLAGIPEAMLSLLTRLVSWCASFQWATVSVNAPPVWLWLALLICALAVSELSRLPGKIKGLCLGLISGCIALSLLFTGGMEATVTFLSVGQADSCVIELKDFNCVIDLGEDAEETIDFVEGEELFVNALFLTHPHTDHAGGLGEFAQACEIDTIYVPEGWENALEGEGIQREWAYALTRCDQWVELSPGDTVQAPDGTVFTVIPSGKSTSSPVNDMSLILLMDCESTRVLFTGDANVGRGPRAEVLKVGHHGSREHTDEDVVKSVSPDVAVISVGKNNSYGHPAPEVVQLLEESGAKVYRTDECGAVVVRIGKWRYRVDTFLEAAQ